MFEIIEKDGLARTAKFHLKDQIVETPAIMPVINPSVELVSPRRLRNEFNAQILITNSYIIYSNKDLKKKALDEGVHNLLDFSGPIMTDSGTFQAHVYGNVDVNPEEILQFQKRIGSDVFTILDKFTEPYDSEKEAKIKVEKTISRAKHAKQTLEEDKCSLAFPVQGSIYPSLREFCAHEMGELEGDVYPIGGVVPLMEDYRFTDLVKAIISSKKGLKGRGPVHLFGAGHPMVYSISVLLGCDLFDSSSYAKYAKRGDLMYPSGTKNIKNIDYLGCECPVCDNHSAEELKEKYNRNDIKPIAEHNLWMCFKEIDLIKQSIKEGSLWELVEKRVRSHPKLLESLKVFDKEHEFLERFEPRSRNRATLYTGEESTYRPCFKRLKKWLLDGYEFPKDGPIVLFDTPDKKPYNRSLREEIELIEDYNANPLIRTPLGPVPLELDEIYPVAQSVFPGDISVEFDIEDYKDKKEIDNLIRWQGERTLEKLEKDQSLNFDEMKIKATADYQFCKGAGKTLTDGNLDFVKNKKGRIKNVFLNDDHVLSIRHYDGFFTLKKPGAKLLKEEFSSPKLRIQVTDESAKFNSEGKNVFSKFIIDMWEQLRHGDEALIVTETDELAAVGRVFLTKEETEFLNRGLAARIREGFEYQYNKE